MRLWSIHPSGLDSKGIVSCWREGLLALKVLKGLTKGYKHHPQLERFRKSDDAIQNVNSYLHYVLQESVFRGYHFNGTKLYPFECRVGSIPVTNLQVGYEYALLEYKVAVRKGETPESFAPYLINVGQASKLVSPLFRVVPGRIESWEKVKTLAELRLDMGQE